MMSRLARRPAGALAVSSVLVLVLSACSAGGARTGDEAATEFTYWSSWKEGEPQQQILVEAIDDFTAETGIEVNVQWQGRDNIQRLVPTLNTPTVPDLIDQSYVKSYPVLVATEQAKGLSTAWETEVEGQPVSELVPAEYLENIDITLENGDPWMIPYTLTSDAVWFDASRFPELKENPPETWEEFIAVLDSMKAEGQAPVAADGDIPGYNVYWFATLLLRSLGPGGLEALASDRSGEAWDDPAVLEAAKQVERLVDGGYLVEGYDASKFPTQQQAWASGKANLLFMGTWAPVETKPYAADGFEYASFPFPKTTGEHNSARADFVGFAVPARAQNADAAQQFAAFFLREEYQEKLAQDAEMLPIRADVEVAPSQEGVKAHLEQADGFHQQNDGVAFPGYNDKVFWAISDELFLGKISAEEFVARAREATVRYWEDQG